MSKKVKKLANTTATARLKQDLLRLAKDPVPYVTAVPLPSNILEWHYAVRGPEKTPYEGGVYHGKLLFPKDFPFKPPSILMITPNGRFKVNTRLCLSISDFHPDMWNPAWSVATILTGLVSFMVEKTPTLGSIETSDYTKRQLALQSLEFNIQNKTFVELFPDISDEMKEKIKELKDGVATSNAPMLDSDLKFKERELGQQQGQIVPHAAFLHVAQNGAALLAGNVANIFVFIGFALFAITVRYVLGTVDD